LATTALAAGRNGTGTNCTRAGDDEYDYMVSDDYGNDCDNDTTIDNNGTSDCEDWGIFDNPCLDDPCDGNVTCIDLTSGTVENCIAKHLFFQKILVQCLVSLLQKKLYCP